MKWITRTVSPAGEAGSRRVEHGGVEEQTETNRVIGSVVGGAGE